MPLDAGDHRKTAKPGAPPTEQEHLPCPRCDSTNTKFCYYNNYNFSQPRHFCKSCRRYWTHGGTLRDIPVGGGSRKNAKRSRTCIPPTASSSAAPVLVPLGSNHGAAVQFGCGGGGELKASFNGCGSFTSLLNTHGGGFWSLGGFGLGLGSGFDDVGYGGSRVAWPFLGMADGGAGGGVNGGTGGAWQFESGDGGFVGGAECLSWPELAISTPGNALK